MQADHVLRALGGAGDLVDIQGRGVGRQDGARLGNPIELRKHLLLERHVFEHRLDQKVGIGQRGLIERRRNQPHAVVHLVGWQAAARHRALVVAS